MSSGKLAMVTAGLLLLAPAARADLSISNKPTANMDCNAGVCTATAKKAVLNVGDLQTMLASGSLTVRTGGIAGSIDIKASFSWASGSQLTLDADCSIAVQKPVTDAGLAAVTLTTNDGSNCGTLVFTGGGRLDVWDVNSVLTINGSVYKLDSDVAMLAKDMAQNTTGHFALANNYDAKADGTYAAAPVRTFNGSFEGLGHSISHLRVNDPMNNANAGLFAVLGASSVVENLALAHFDIVGTTNAGVGGLAGTANGTIANVSTDGSAAAPTGTAGGLIGYNAGLVILSRTSGSVSGVAAGGLVGFDYGRIQQSRSSAAVSGFFAGGFTGYEEGNIANSSASGRVQTSVANVAAAAGGFAGYFAGGLIVQSFATGAVSGQNSTVGGFAGYFGVTAGGGGINDCYATGAVKGTGSSFAGGFAGWSQESFDLVLARAYAIGAVSTAAASVKGKAGGFIGWDDERMFDDEISDAYWDFDTTGISDPSQGAGDPANDPGIAGLTDAQLKTALPPDFDPKVWGQSPGINSGYPYLLANPPQ